MFLGLTQDFKSGYATPIGKLDNLWSITNYNNHFSLLSNVCPHQYSKIAKSPTSRLLCPYHGLEFDLSGQGLNTNCELGKKSLHIHNGMLFDQPVNCDFPVHTNNLELVWHRIDNVNASADMIMDVFLDIDHIPVAHAGVYDRVGITSVDDITYSLFDGGSIQIVPAHNLDHMIDQDKQLGFGACWMALYPGTMIEWQPGALFVTVCTSQGVAVYKYRDIRYTYQTWKLNEDVWETAWAQDRALSEALVCLADSNLGPLKQHHRDFYAVQK